MLRCALRPLALTALLAGMLLAACGAAEPPSSFATVAELSGALDDSGLRCELAYEGLRDGAREVSTCRIEGEFALLQIWDDAALVAELIETEPPIAPQAYGENWIVDVESEAVAQRVADALRGTARTPEAP